MKQFLTITLALFLFSCKKDSHEVFITNENRMLSFVIAEGKDSVSGIIGDSTIELLVKDSSSRQLYPVFSSEGKVVMVDEIAQTSGISTHNFRKPVIYKVVAASGQEKLYTVYARYLNRLPVWYINTNGSDITDKENYVTGNITIDGNSGTLANYNMGIRGRGNTTWGRPKNPYKVKLNDKQSIFGFPEDKEWALLANWFDKSLLRNDVAFELSERLEREWTPKRKFFDMYIFGQYNGNYLLTETIKTGKNRVNIDTKNGGYLLEVNYKPEEGDPRIQSDFGPVDVKEGSLPVDTIKDQINKVYAKLVTNQFDPLTGYQKEFDLDAFVSWYLVNEIMINNDAVFYSSVFIQKNNKDSKIKMSAVWDFDLSSGNVNWGQVNPEGWYLKQGNFTINVWQDPAFQIAVREKWNKYHKEILSLPDYIDKQSKFLNMSASANFIRFNILNATLEPTVVVPGTYQGEIDYFRNWMIRRISWMDSQINN